MKKKDWKKRLRKYISTKVDDKKEVDKIMTMIGNDKTIIGRYFKEKIEKEYE